ncbi:cellulase family glycosylhydrolase [Halococcoides cellulosivorans]|nr:cellulase family glycosylhydrolase [Halococcoides cellulosivorans]
MGHTDDGDRDRAEPTDVSRRRFLQSGAVTGALAVGAGAGLASAATSIDDASIESFAPLAVDPDNRIVRGDTGEVFTIRGLNVPDPKRMAITEQMRGKTMNGLINMITDTTNGWHPRAIRIPAQPCDIGEHPIGNTGPTWEEFAPEVIENETNEFMTMDRTLQRPPQPPAFTQEQLETYLQEYYDPVVEHCKERGVYCIVDFHRHWHEQPPGDGEGSGPTGMGPEGAAEAENHLPYDSEYTNYWASNAFYGTDHPASWGYVDQTFRNSMDAEYVTEEMIDSGETPYTQWEVNQALVDEALMFWDTVAERYADEPHVVFEPFNEPTAPGIWGPVEDYGAYMMKPLWHTFVDEFATPLIDTIREHTPDTHIMMGLPGWCQATQAVHWRPLPDDNLSITWHNYAGHGVSREANWLNEKCVGEGCWEPEQSQGLQEAMDVHPVAVTEFGWFDREYADQVLYDDQIEIDKWIRGSIPPQQSTESYGKPFIEAMESDDRISWVAWCADNRWLPTMFKPITTNQSDFELTNGNYYETPDDEFPVNCEELPCEWELWDDPNMGQYVKDTLAEHKDDRVPFPSEYNPTDPDGDGLYEDVNENGKVDFNDVNELFQRITAAGIEDDRRFDFTGDGTVDVQDVLALFEMV